MLSQNDAYAIKGLKFKGEKGGKWKSFCGMLVAVTKDFGWTDANRRSHVIRMLEGNALDFFTTITRRDTDMEWTHLSK